MFAFYRFQSTVIFFASPEDNYPPVKDEATQSQRGSVVFPRITQLLMAELKLEVQLSDSSLTSFPTYL